MCTHLTVDVICIVFRWINKENSLTITTEFIIITSHSSQCDNGRSSLIRIIKQLRPICV